MTVRVSDDEVIAFRLAAHHLDERLSSDELMTAAGACGIQNSPPGSALTALHARVKDLDRDRFESAVGEEKNLVQSWSMRGAPFFFPTADLPTFTTGVLPTTEASKRHFVLGVERSLDDLGIDLTDLVDAAREEIHAVLGGRRLPVGELGRELADRVETSLTKAQRKTWRSEGPYAEGQSLGEGVVHFGLRILTLQRVICFAPREHNTAPFVLLDEWLENASEGIVVGPNAGPVSDADRDRHRADLLRRYLHCCGPSTRADFAAWLGIRSTEAQPWWDLLDAEIIEVDRGRRAWMLAEDVESLRAATMPRGVRLLPPRDPYTQMRDRETIVSKDHHSEVWKTVGEPGAVLVDGSIAGTWRAKKSGQRLKVDVATFATASAQVKKAINTEAEAIGTLRAANDLDIAFSSD